MEIENLVKLSKKNRWKKCIYGLGFLGQRMSGYFEKTLNIKIDFFTDSNDNLISELRKANNMVAIHKEELLKMEDDVLVLVLVDYPYDCEIKKELLSHSNLHIISLDELANSEVIQKDFYGENLFNQIKRLDDYSTCELEVGKKFEMTRNKKVAFYTCILGDYDELKQPEYVEECHDGEAGIGGYGHLSALDGVHQLAVGPAHQAADDYRQQYGAAYEAPAHKVHLHTAHEGEQPADYADRQCEVGAHAGLDRGYHCQHQYAVHAYAAQYIGEKHG